ncbi:MAG: exosortase family protein XrtG [Syntrophomonadaceae bacterium]|nr:exosortase family protein XrtG [Syntrophomonadaceae bacterium]MDD4549067.1 exosortase family protein XrtG [Syntrophomonadaceae bacterium]
MYSDVSLTLIIILSLVWFLPVLFFRYYKIWILYFITGVGGFTVLGAFILNESWFENFLSATAVGICARMADYLSLQVQAFADAGIMLISSPAFSGFTSMSIDIECSGMLEMLVVWALIIFFPIFDRGERVWYLFWGSIMVYLVNLVRILVILLALSYWGRDSIFIVHTVIARGIFFILIVMIFWEIFTRKSIECIRKLHSGGDE